MKLNFHIKQLRPCYLLAVIALAACSKPRANATECRDWFSDALEAQIARAKLTREPSIEVTLGAELFGRDNLKALRADLKMHNFDYLETELHSCPIICSESGNAQFKKTIGEVSVDQVNYLCDLEDRFGIELTRLELWWRSTTVFLVNGRA